MSALATATAPNRRDRKVAATRQSILDAALGLFAEQGFGETTIEQITERADVGQRTFFRYFPTKESVLFDDIEHVWNRVLAAFAERPRDEHPFASLRMLLHELAEFAAEDAKQLELRIRLIDENPSIMEYHRQLFTVRWGTSLTTLVADRLGVDPAVDPRPPMWTALALSAFRVGFEQWLAAGRAGDLAQFIDRALGAAAGAFDAPPAD